MSREVYVVNGHLQSGYVYIYSFTQNMTECCYFTVKNLLRSHSAGIYTIKHSFKVSYGQGFGCLQLDQASAHAEQVPAAAAVAVPALANKEGASSNPYNVECMQV